MTVRRIFETQLDDGKTALLIGKESGDTEIHVDGAWGMTFAGGICKISLFSVAPEEDPNIERREVAARLTMSAQTLFAFKEFFDRQCKTLLEQGIIAAVPPEETAMPEKTKKKKAKF